MMDEGRYRGSDRLISMHSFYRRTTTAGSTTALRSSSSS
jgi:hypothetical protein